MKRMILAATSPEEYNAKQTSVGSTLKTYKGSPIKRSKFGVGKEIGGDFYVHKDYADIVIPEDKLEEAKEIVKREWLDGYAYNCLKYSPAKNTIAFQEVWGFDTEREPVVGDYIIVDLNKKTVKAGHSDYIFHHKWLWVENDYTGFDVKESWEWSKEWLSTLKETSDGNGIARWNAQLQRYGLPLDE